MTERIDWSAVTERQCSRCGQTKPATEFSVTVKATGELHTYCKPCLAEWQREWRAKNPGKQKGYKRKWEAKNREKHLAYRRQRNLGRDGERGREWRQENPDRLATYGATAKEVRRAGRRDDFYRHRLLPEQVDAILLAQDHRCGICSVPLDLVAVAGRHRAWHIDHDHACCPHGKSCGECARGVLCQKCNPYLAWFEGRPDIVTAYMTVPPTTRFADLLPAVSYVPKQSLGRIDYDRHHVDPPFLAALAAAQSDGCAICGAPLRHGQVTEGRRRWNIDHDHKCCDGPRSCGLCIRGLICQRCNGILGWFENNASAVASYLASPPARRI